MKIVEEQNCDVAIFKLSGRLDTNTSPALEEKVLQAIDHGSSKIIVDFAALDYVSSAGLRVLNLAAKRLSHKDGKIILCSMQDYIKEVFEIAGFDTFIPIVSDMGVAMTQF